MLNSLMRTLVPAIYLGLIHLGLAHGIARPWELDVISLALLAVIYLGLRYLEQHWRWFGVLLGWVGAPTYGDTAPPAVEHARAATLNELQAIVKATENVIVSQLESRVHTIVQERTAQQGVATAAALKAVMPTAARKAPAKKAVARKAPAKKAAAPKP